MLYMLMICYDPTQPARADEPSLQPEHHKLERELRERGLYISGAALWPVEMGKTVRVKDDEVLTTDGPFAETKEALGGYYIVECDQAEAFAIAARIPAGRGWVQVRQIALFHSDVERIARWAADARKSPAAP